MTNVVQILKQAPAGTKLWSNIFGEVSFIYVKSDEIICKRAGGSIWAFYKDGKYYDFSDAECTLWPSKDHRAWDDEAYKILGIEKKPPFGLQPFDKVLVRDNSCQHWQANFFSHIDTASKCPFVCISGRYRYCIPYDEETKHLAGTNQNAIG